MRNWLADIPNLCVPGVPSVQPQNSAILDECSGVPAGVPEHLSGTPGTLGGIPARNDNVLKSNAEHSEHLEHLKKSVQAPISEAQAKALLRDWHCHLSAVDPLAPPSGWCPRYWRLLVDDAQWLYEFHASYAVRNGWSDRCLFAVREGMPRLGSLADMLEGSRDLKLVGGRAYWTILGVPHRINVGAGDGSGAVLLWEVGK